MIGYSFSNINKLKNIQKIDSEKLSLIDSGEETINSVDLMCKNIVKKGKTETTTNEISDLNLSKNEWFNVYKYDESKSLKSVEKKSVSCIVTTPPIFDEKITDRNSYIDSVYHRLIDCKDIMKDDGNMFLIVSDSHLENGEMSHIPHRLISKLTNFGYHHIDTIIWEYTNTDVNDVKRRQLIPSYKYIFHLTKNLEYFINPFRSFRKDVLPTNPNGDTKNELCKKYQTYKGKEWKNIVLQKDVIKTTNSDLTESESPSSILQKIPIGLILDTTKENDVVFNPYSDNENVGCVSIFYDRRYIGYTEDEDSMNQTTHRLNDFYNHFKNNG